jgi:hypothetical protein
MGPSGRAALDSLGAGEAARGPRARYVLDVLSEEGTVSKDDGHVHDLSVPGGRPLCGADAVMDPPPRQAAPVSCPACVRLLGDDARRKAHAARPHAHESDD